MTRHYYTADGRHWVLMEIDDEPPVPMFDRVAKGVAALLAAIERFYAYPKRK